MTKFVCLAGAVVGLAAACGAAIAAPVATVSASAKPRSVARGGHGALTIMLVVQPGYHINANKLTDPSYIPTVVKPKAAAGVSYGAPVYPASHTVQMAGVGPLQVYTGRVAVKVPYTIARSAKPGTVSLGADISYQGCNATSCYPPVKASASASVAVK